MDGILRLSIVAAGVGQLVLILASLAIPRVLGWREETARLRPMTRQVFWTYAAYIWGTNFAFGLVSACAPDALLGRTLLSACVTGFIATYWLARVGIHFFCFDRGDIPGGRGVRLAEAGLVVLFISLTAVYAWATVHNVAGSP